MKGVVLGGGSGTRLREVTGGKNKHTVEVGGQPMIFYPLATLGAIGCEKVIIVSSPDGKEDIEALVGDRHIGMDVEYAIQENPAGTADALSKAKGKVEGVFPVICGDVFLDPAPSPVSTPTLFWHEFENGNQHSVWDPRANKIIEQPSSDLGKKAVVFYFYDEAVFDFIPSIKPSARGELELVDIHNHYLQQQGAAMTEYKGFFADMGTPAGIKRVEDYLSQNRSAL